MSLNMARLIWLRIKTKWMRGSFQECFVPRMVVGFTTTYAISAYHNWRCEIESSTWRGVLDTILGYKVCYWLPAGRWLDRLPKHFKSIICDLQLHTRSPYHKNSDFSTLNGFKYECINEIWSVLTSNNTISTHVLDL
jgi:hypothetical protein